MMNGLVEYDDDSQSEEENRASSSKVTNHNNDKSLKLAPGTLVHSEPRKLQKSQVIIRRTGGHKNQSRAHISSGIEEPEAPHGHESLEAEEPSAILEDAEMHPSRTPEPVVDELARIRAILVPPPIPGVEDWGIPPPSTDPPDPAITTKLAQFHNLKTDVNAPKHFNDSLMSNRSFRNPHLFAKLVEFVDVDERVTNFPSGVWSPGVGLQPEWYAEKIAEYQRQHSEHVTTPGKRTQIGFVPSAAKEKEKAVGVGHARKSRFQPYYFDPGAKSRR